MNVREACFAAADLIEGNPDRYNFMANRRPECGTTGCMAGWVGVFLGVERTDDNDFYQSRYTHNVAHALGHEELQDFLDAIKSCGVPTGAYQHSASAAANGLRLYADAYHPAEQPKREGIPESVRAIFEPAKEVA